MSVEYFNGIDELVREVPKEHVQFIDSSEKNAKINGGSAVSNPDYVANDQIDTIKTQRYNEIDTKTVSMITSGLTHDSSNFSLSSNAQFNWNSIKVRSEAAELTFPYTVSTSDNSEHEFADKAALDLFIDDVFSTVEGHLATGRALKVSIGAASSMTAIKAITDNR